MKQLEKGNSLIASYQRGRNNLLSALLVSVVNIILGAVEATFYFPFCAWLPYQFGYLGILQLMEFDALPLVSQRLTLGYLLIAVVALVVLLLCWIFSRKHFGWLITAFVLFSLDLGVLVWSSVSFQLPELLLDIFFHIWILVILFLGLRAGIRARKMPSHISAEPETLGEEPKAL